MKDCPLYMGTDIKTARFRVCKFIRCVCYLHRTILIVLESWHVKSKDGSRNLTREIQISPLLSFFFSKKLFIDYLKKWEILFLKLLKLQIHRVPIFLAWKNLISRFFSSRKITLKNDLWTNLFWIRKMEKKSFKKTCFQVSRTTIIFWLIFTCVLIITNNCWFNYSSFSSSSF